MIESFFLFHLLQNEMNIENWVNLKFFCWRKHLFVKQETVNKLLIENNENASSIERESDLNKLEETWIQMRLKKSDVFVSIDGVLKAVVKQKTL
jgi:cell division protein FtsQ